MYDLDKTQEWLNRTLQLSRTPPIRGGTTSEPHGRRTTAVSVACAILIMALCIAITPWIRTSGAGESSVVVAQGRVSDRGPSPNRAESLNRGEVEARPIAASAPTFAPRRDRVQPRATWIGTSLDGNIVPLPGYAPPPAPVWLDGGIRSR